MASYLNQNGNSIGSLLRFIQEQKSISPVMPQASEVGSPIRDVVQEPLKGSEGQGTSKVVSLRPEGTLTPSGQPIEQGTPQSSRIGPISIGGTDVSLPPAPASVVAANEPGPGMGIPSSTKTVGDVMNKTAGASEIKPPSLGTSIKPQAPTTKAGNVVRESKQGENIINYNFRNTEESKNKQDSETALLNKNVKENIAMGDRSLPETEARIKSGEEAFSKLSSETQDLNNLDQYIKDFTKAAEAYYKNPTSETRKANDLAYANIERVRNAANTLSPSPTPMPMQGAMASASGQASRSSGGSGSSSNQSSGGQVKGVSTTIKPALSYSTPQKQNITYSQAPAVNVQQAVKSGGLSTPVKPSAPSKPAIQQSPWGWLATKLFGR